MMLETINLSPRVGTEIRADATDLLSGEHAPQIRDILGERGLVLFRQLNLDDRRTGGICPHAWPSERPGRGSHLQGHAGQDGDQDRRLPARYVPLAHRRHDRRDPSRASLLSARRLSETGGQTEMGEHLRHVRGAAVGGEGRHRLLAGRALGGDDRTGSRPDFTEEDVADWRTRPLRSHPLVSSHVSGRKSLVLGATASHVEGMEPDESRALLNHLMEQATQPQLVYRHEWQYGDLMVWDNTGTMHRVVPYSADSGRLMHRTTLVGEEPLA